MPYGYPPVNPSYYSGGGGGYSANPVTSGGGGGYAPPSSMGGGYGGFSGPMSSQSGGQPQGGGGGMDANMWMALFSAIGNRLSDRMNSGAVKEASRADIPSEAYGKALGGMVENMGREGELLKTSELSPRARMAARASGARAADQRGLQGPLAASVAGEAENEAQGQYDQWRMPALQQHRMMYLNLVQQYLQALQQRKAAIDRFNAASREETWAKIPVGPIGKAIGQGVGLDEGKYERMNGAYGTPYVPSY